MRSVFAFLVLVAGLAGTVVAKPGNVAPTVAVGSSGGAVTYGTGAGAASFSRMTTASPGSAAQIIDNIRVGLPANAALEFAAGRIITKAALTAAVGIAVGTGVGAVAVTALPFLWEQLKGKGVLPSAPGVDGPAVDPRAPPVPQTKYVTPLSGGCGHLRSGTPSQAGAACVALGLGPYDYVISEGCQGVQCYYYNSSIQRRSLNTGTGLPYNTAVSNIQHTIGSITLTDCISINQPLIAAIRTGSCATDLRVAATPADIAIAVQSIDESISPQVVAELEPKLEIQKQPVALQGPAAVQSPNPTVTTKPDGTVETKTVTHNITYNNNTWNYTTTNENVSVKDSVTTTEQTVNPEKPEPDKTDCEKTPDIIGCAKFGEATDAQPNRASKSVDFGNNDLGGAGSCPASESFTVMGKSYALAWTPICNAASTYVRPVVLLLAAAAGAFIFIGGLKS